MPKEFLTDVETLRRRARASIEQGPITEAYGADAPEHAALTAMEPDDRPSMTSDDARS